MKALLGGVSYKTTGTMQFPDGSWANGAPMRITPLGIAFRNATDNELYEATRQALLATHVHPDAVDAAFVVCKAISLCFAHNGAVNELDLDNFLNVLHVASRSPSMKDHIKAVIDHRKDDFKSFEEEQKYIKFELADDFQIVAVDAVALVLWAFVRHFQLGPAKSITKIIGYGGDTDTTACILGGILGALHGTHWIPWKWYSELENNDWGRDYCINLAKGLAKLDLHNIVSSVSDAQKS